MHWSRRLREDEKFRSGTPLGKVKASNLRAISGADLGELEGS